MSLPVTSRLTPSDYSESPLTPNSNKGNNDLTAKNDTNPNGKQNSPRKQSQTSGISPRKPRHPITKQHPVNTHSFASKPSWTPQPRTRIHSAPIPRTQQVLSSTPSSSSNLSSIKLEPPSLPWYNKHANDDDEDDDDDDVDDDDSDARHDPQLRHKPFDFDLAGASTPLNSQNHASQNPNNTLAFLSPINKLNNLHLESSISSSSPPGPSVQPSSSSPCVHSHINSNKNFIINDILAASNDDTLRNVARGDSSSDSDSDSPHSQSFRYDYDEEEDTENDHGDEDDDNDDDDDEFRLGNQTIDDSGSEVEFRDDSLALDKSPPSIPGATPMSAPRYINQRKRKRFIHDSPSDMMIVTPRADSHTKLTNSLPSASSDVNIDGNVINMSIGSQSSFKYGPSSAVKDMSDICFSSISNTSLSKISFANSDSTPCPVQPRKKLKFKQHHANSSSSSLLLPHDETTPSQSSKIKQRKHNILNLSHSIRTSAAHATSKSNVMTDAVSTPLIAKLTNAHSSASDDNDTKDERQLDDDALSSPVTNNNTVFSHIQSHQNNTPISQSTPANSRAPSPPTHEEYGEPINGFKFIKPSGVRPPSNFQQQHPYYSYQTPPANRYTNTTTTANTNNSNGSNTSGTGSIPSVKSHQWKQSFQSRNFEYPPSGIKTTGKYQIMGEMPVTSAGLMDESDDDLHIGDKRINDPYLHQQRSTPSDSPMASYELNRRIKNQYLAADDATINLPLLPWFETTGRSGPPLSQHDLISLINDGVSVIGFYKFILVQDDDEQDNKERQLLDFLKRERIRWHPDKWVGKLNENSTVGKPVIDNLSQVLNSLVENFR